ncbi:MAG: hypothetical protein WC489_01925 [Patescibacteria group bacterium]
MRFKKSISYFTLLFVVLISTFLVWFPFLTRQENFLGLKIADSNFQYVYRHFDGPLYIIPAKTLYNTKKIESINRDSILSQDPKYFSAHLPLYPLFIRGASVFFGYLKSMIGVTLLFSIASALLFYFILHELNLTKKPLILTLVFIFLPRFLVVRSVGSPEPLFLFLIMISLYFFEKEKYLFSGIAGALSVMTKTPGLLLFGAYGLVISERILRTKKITPSWIWLILIPLGFLSVCILYAIQMNDFLAYFHSGDNIHLIAPFAVFNFQKTWVGTAWLEDVLFYFFLYGVTVYQLAKNKHRSFFYFSLIYWVAILFVEHRDISRYSLPLWPMALIAFEHFFTSKKFIVISGLLLAGIYVYVWNFIIYNGMPITEWLPFL